MSIQLRWRVSLANRTLLALLLGGVVGLLIGPSIAAIQIVGDVFLKLLQMALVPLIFFSVISAIANIGDISRLSRIGGKAIVLFVLTSTSAAALGVVISRLIGPGTGLILKDLPPVKTLADNPDVSKTVLALIPGNIIQALAEGNMIQIIVFAVFAGVAIILSPESEREKVTAIFNTLFQFIMKILSVIIELSPYGVFALTAVTAGKYGPQVIGPLSRFIVTIYAGIFAQLLLVLFVLYFIFVRQNPITFFKTISPIWITSLSTCSTRATMPVSIKTSEQELGLPKELVGFTIPLGASANMNGNALWYSSVAVFVSQLVGIDLTFSQQVLVVALSVLMTIGSPGIPGGIIVLTAVFLKSLGLPIEVIGLLAGIFRILDMGLTTLNVLGTIFVTTILARFEPTAEKQLEPATEEV
ncbi:MAG: dicarboxylate/amino acid:cation symporter [Negativicutes bacterium]